MTNNVIAVDGRVFSSGAHDRGMGRYVSLIIEVLVDAGYDVALILYENSQLADKSKIYDVCASVQHIPLNIEKYDEQDIHHSSAQLETLLDSINAALYIDATPFIPPMRYDLTVCPTIAIAYDLIPLRYQKYYFDSSMQVPADFYRNGLRRLISADHIIAISEFAKNNVTRYLGVKEESVSCLYPNLDDAYYDKNILSKNNEIFSIVGSHYSKNPENALSTISALNMKHNIKCKITVPTDSQYADFLSKYPQLLKNLKILTAISEEKKICYQAESKCVMHLSLEEGFGIPLLEALFLNTKVICYDIPINREILSVCGDENSIALFLSPEDKTHDYDSMITFIQTPLTKKSAQAFTKIKDFFITHWTKDAKAIIKSAICHASLQYKQKIENIKLTMQANMPGNFCGVADYAASIPCAIPGNMIIYTGDTKVCKLYKNDNVIIKSHSCFCLDSKMKLPSIYHLAVSTTLWFGLENLRVYGNNRDIVIIHDHSYLYGIYHLYYYHRSVSQFIEYYFIGDDLRFALKIPKVRLLSYKEFQEVTRNFQHIWLRKTGAQFITHLTDEAEKAFQDFSQSLSKILDAKHCPMGINERLTVQTKRRSKAWKIKNGIYKNDILIGVFGSVTDNKLLDEVASAVSAVCLKNKKPGSRIFFLVAGIVHCQETFKKISDSFSSNGLADIFIYNNPKDEIDFDALILAADISFVCRKQYRGQLSHIIPRALCLGSLIITNQSSGYSMLSKKFIIPDEDFINHSIKKLESIINGQIDRRDEAVKNREMYTRKFSSQKMVGNFLSLCEKII